MQTPRQFYRYWGLLTVSSEQRRSHEKTYRLVCEAAEKEAAEAGMCISPYCRYLQSKCQATQIIMYVSYLVAAVLALCIVTVVSGALLQCLNRTNFKRAALYMFLFSSSVQVMNLAVYLGAMNVAFLSANQASYYPMPNISASYVIACIAAAITVSATCFLSADLHRRKRESQFIEDVFEDIERAERLYRV